MFQGTVIICTCDLLLLQLTTIEIKLSVVRRDITPITVQIVTNRETGEGLIGRPGGSTTEDDGWLLPGGGFAMAGSSSVCK